jgi:hypothetical protein
MGVIADLAKKFDKMFDGDIGNAEPYASASSAGLISPEAQENNSRSDWWEIYPERWYQVFPYQFVIKTGDLSLSNEPEEELAVYTLPIPPQALSMRMIPASVVTPTLGGVVEETSANVFWEINLSGTTGIAIGKKGSIAEQLGSPQGGILGAISAVKNVLFGHPPAVASKFRDVIKTTGAMSGVFGALSSAVGKVTSSLDQLDQATADPSASSIVGAASGILQNMLLPTPRNTASAVPLSRNGFGEIQQMHRFLLVYSRLKGAFPNKYYLKFRMYKTNQIWMCSLQDFQISQNVQNPNSYRYNINLKCWQVADAGNDETVSKMAYDRFAAGGDLAPVNILSLKQASAGLKKSCRSFK